MVRFQSMSDCRCNVLPAALHPSKHCCVVYADGGVHHYTKYQVITYHYTYLTYVTYLGKPIWSCQSIVHTDRFKSTKVVWKTRRHDHVSLLRTPVQSCAVFAAQSESFDWISLAFARSMIFHVFRNKFFISLTRVNLGIERCWYTFILAF